MVSKFSNLSSSFSTQFRDLRGKPPGQWPILPQFACALGVLIGVVLLGWFLYLDGRMDAWDAAQQEEAKQKEAYKTKIQQAVNLEALIKQKEQVREYVLAMEKQLPSKAEMDALLSDINQAGLGRGLQFELFKPGQAVVKDYHAELPINVRVTGNYHDIASFSSDIANLSRIVTLNNLNITSGKDGGLTLDAVAKTFRYLDEEEVKAQRKAKAEEEAKKKGANR